MLVLTRRLNESITIGDDIEITIVEATSTQVRIGISAPRAMPVYRTEIYLQRQQSCCQSNLEGTVSVSDTSGK